MCRTFKSECSFQHWWGDDLYAPTWQSHLIQAALPSPIWGKDVILTQLSSSEATPPNVLSS